MSKYFNINNDRSKTFLTLTLSVFILGYVGNVANVIAEPQQKIKKAPSKIKAKFVEGEILVRFKANTKVQAEQSIITNHGGRSVKSISKKMKISKVKLQPGDDVSVAVEAYKSNPNIEHVQPNYIYHANALPNDSSFGQLWALKNTAQTISNSAYTTNNPGTSGYDIDAESAWDKITDCRSTVVAILDTGINYTHQDLSANMWDGSGAGYPNHGYDFIDGDNDPMPTGAKEDHATHVAGIIGAAGNNSSGVTGVCWQANIMSVRVLGATGSGSTVAVIKGIEFAADQGASVINMSFGSEGAFDPLFNDAITYARARDVVVVVTAGNGGKDIVSDDNDGLGDDGDISTIVKPCNFSQDNLLCVAALDQSYSLASFSNYGAISVDIGAPGTNILSSYAGQKLTDDFTSGWLTIGSGWANGTCASYATLSNPGNRCSGGTYGNNIDDRVYKSFNLSGALTAELGYFMSVNTEADFDIFSTAMKSNGGDPFAAGGTILSQTSGSTAEIANNDISLCNTSTCTLGFRLTSDIGTVSTGVGIHNFEIRTLQTNSTSYYPYNGTSMAASHVAAIATMVRAFNPKYTYSQTIEAIKNGGEVVAALSGKTTTGRAANAMGSLSYITQPTGVAAVVK